MEATPKDSHGAQIISALENTFRKYAALDTGLPLVLALWTLSTHVFDCFDTFPYLGITSPTKRCGKTRVAEIIELLSCDALLTAGASSAAIYRTIQAQDVKKHTVTLLMDEAEMLRAKSERAEQLREILNAGYRRGQYVLKCEGDKHEPRRFKVFCPKVLVLIGALPDTLADRCIPIGMRRRRPSEHLCRFFYTQAKWHARRILKEIAKWATTSRAMVRRRLRRDMLFLEDREAELWLPLFAVCSAACPDRAEEFKRIATRISHGKQSSEPGDLGIALLTDIRPVFDQCREERLPSSKLLLELNAIEESAWPSWSDGRGLDPRGLARLLRPFRIEPRNLRLDSGLVVKGYARTDFEEAWATYLPANSAATPLQTATVAGTNGVGDPLRTCHVAEGESEKSPPQSRHVAV
jgi:Protein of unknown function (DUF3631)